MKFLILGVLTTMFFLSTISTLEKNLENGWNPLDIERIDNKIRVFWKDIHKNISQEDYKVQMGNIFGVLF
jgi:preprotein translocase subunit Sec63